MKTDFKLQSTDGTEKTLESYKGKYLVLYFYPKDNTSVCTIEANGFADLYDEFKNLDAEIVGISKDTIGSHIKFKEKQNLPFELLSDPEREVHENYEVLKPAKMYGKDVIKTIRSTFVFDKDSNLIKEFRKVDGKTHPKEVLEYLKSL
ncbi:peroxiredoxin [Peptoniphilus catoniae]|uniref:peroxiredoxin n=1 Tax=Peptoniphilus catoniae TaxID=1660341 RepID=UPI0010FDFB7F|nr:peroxiredoxin [Peptoniphilus catoniae]